MILITYKYDQRNAGKHYKTQPSVRVVHV